MFRFKRSPKSDDWLSFDRGKIEGAPRFGSWRSQQNGSQDTFEYYVVELERRRKDGVLPTMVLDDEASWDSVRRYLQGTDKFGLSLNNQRVEVEFKEKHATQLHIQNSKQIQLESCEVLDLVIGTKDFEINNAELCDCRIGRLTLGGKIHRLEIRNTEIQHLVIRHPLEVHGPVSLPGARFSYAPAQLQHFRTLRKKLTDIHNLDAAGIVHAAELRISRSSLDFVERLISRLYEMGSRYGTESWRALGWVLAAILFNVLFLILFDGTAVSRTDNLPGWQEYLQGKSYSSALRASYLAFGQTFNPGGVFGPLSLVVTTNPLIGVASSVIGFIGTAAFALLLLAIRRRFRLEG